MIYLLIGGLLSTGAACHTTSRPDEPAKGKLSPATSATLFQRLGEIEGAGNSEKSPFSRDGSKFITMMEGSVRVYETRTLKPVTEMLWHAGADKYRLAADGKSVFTADKHEVWIWDVATSTRRSAMRVPGHAIDTLEISPDGKHFLTSVGDNVLTLWLAGEVRPTAQLLQGISLPVGIFDPTGTRIVTHAHARGFHIWAADTGKETSPMIESDFNGFAPFYAPFDPQGRRLLLQLWHEGFVVVDPATGKTLSHVSLPKEWEADKLQFGSDGNKIIVLSYQSLRPCPVRVYDSKTLKLEREFGNEVFSCQVAEQGHLALCTPQNPPEYPPELWDIMTGTRLQIFPVPTKYNNSYLSPDGSTILINSSSGVTEVWRRRD